jgi:hypothetical protein
MAGMHVIEIREGAGEPRALELPLGEERAPFGVGTEGSWRVRAQGVLGTHAYLYFDGEALFVQSADDRNPAKVDGRSVGATWTSLTPPCTLSLGGARLYFHAEGKLGDDDRTIPLPVDTKAPAPPLRQHFPAPAPVPAAAAQPMAGARWAAAARSAPPSQNRAAQKPADPDTTRPQEGRTQLMPLDSNVQPAPPRVVPTAHGPAPSPPIAPKKKARAPASVPPKKRAPPPGLLNIPPPPPPVGLTARIATEWKDTPLVRKVLVFLMLATLALVMWNLFHSRR